MKNNDICPDCLRPWGEHEFGVPAPYCPRTDNPPQTEKQDSPAQAALGVKKVCCECNWTNTDTQLWNLGEPNALPRWVCQGCCKRIINERYRLTDELDTQKARCDFLMLEATKYIAENNELRKELAHVRATIADQIDEGISKVETTLSTPKKAEEQSAPAQSTPTNPKKKEAV